MTTAQKTFDDEALVNATEIAERPNHAPDEQPTPLALLSQAIERGYKPEDLGALMDLQERHERNRAAEEYGKAIAEFQRRCPRVVKRREAKIKSDKGSYSYAYAAYEDVMEQAGPVLAELGLAVSFSTEARDKGIRCTMRVRKGIHCEDHTMDVPVPAMNVNDTQRYGAALSYAKRYTFCSGFNIVVVGEDSDAAICIDPVNDEQLNLLDELMTQVVQKFGEPARASFYKFIGCDRLSDIPAKDFAKAETAIRSKLRAAH